MNELVIRSTIGAVCTVDRRASKAGAAMLAVGGNAVDAAVAASAVLAVTTQHMCGMGGDLFALVHTGDGAPYCLNASGWAGTGADPDRLRSDGRVAMPFRGDIRAVPVPGCVDGWTSLADRFGSLPMATVLEPAISYASGGFEVPDHLAKASAIVDGIQGADDYQGLQAGQYMRRPAVARVLHDIVDGGRDAFYLGRFGTALVAFGNGEFDRQDLEQTHGAWVEPLSLDAWGHRLWTVPPNSQGYLILAGAGIADELDLPDVADDLWAHYLIEAARHAAFDRIDSLYDGADGSALITSDRLADRRAHIAAGAAARLGDTYTSGGTVHLTAVDRSGWGVSLIQSNAAGFGAHLVVPETGIFLHNRGIGFNLTPGHPAEYRPRRRPPHTLAPALVTSIDGALRAVLGTMGGDAQPQIVLQMLARLLHHRQSPGEVLAAPRWVLRTPDSTGFDTWIERDSPAVVCEPSAPASWERGLAARGHSVQRRPVGVGHAHLIEIIDGVATAATEPRIDTSAAVAP